MNCAYLCGIMTHYPAKILMAFACTFEPEQGDEFSEWLMRNGFPELCALSQTIQGDTKAKDWLMEHNFPQLAAIDSVIDKEAKAEDWLLRNHFEVNLAFAKAINRDDDATEWLEKNELQIFIVIADKIRNYLDDKYLNFHKIHF